MAHVNRKRRTREHIIADLGVNHVEKCILECGWTVQRFSPDYGLDLLHDHVQPARGDRKW